MKQLKYNKETITWVPCGDEIKGEILWDSETDLSEQIPMILVDGKEFTWREFGRTLLTHEGFKFVLKFIDPTTTPEDHEL